MTKKTGVYSVEDTISEEYGPLFEAVNDRVAIRQFQNLLKKVQYPSDFNLHRVGYFGPSGQLELSDGDSLVIGGQDAYRGLLDAHRALENEYDVEIELTEKGERYEK